MDMTADKIVVFFGREKTRPALSLIILRGSLPVPDWHEDYGYWGWIQIIASDQRKVRMHYWCIRSTFELHRKQLEELLPGWSIEHNEDRGELWIKSESTSLGLFELIKIFATLFDRAILGDDQELQTTLSEDQWAQLNFVSGLDWEDLPES